MSETTEEKSVLQWLARDYPDSPKKRLKGWFAEGRVILDGVPILKSHLLMEDPGPRLRMGKAVATARVFAQRMPCRIHAQLNLLYIDASLAIVNKGPGLLSVPLVGKSQASAQAILEKYLQGNGLKPLPVHRLDQYTSGLLCFAMNTDAREHLVKQVRQHSFIREYMALGDGMLSPGKGSWRCWFRLDEEGMEQSVFDGPVENAVEAVSHYEVLEEITWPLGKGRSHTVSRLRLRLETGLKHQLRIHAARAGAPLLGDRFYHPDFKKAARLGSNPAYGIKRQALHASSIGFIHPESRKTKRFSSKFPRDLADLEARLRAKADK